MNLIRAIRAAIKAGAAEFRRTRYFQRRRVNIPPTF
jgi:hypothetical protein